MFYIDKTSYPISCSLPGQALPATAGSEAPQDNESRASARVKPREGLYLAASIMWQESKAGQKG
nr:hypothetical protein [Escherichia coli]